MYKFVIILQHFRYFVLRRKDLKSCFICYVAASVENCDQISSWALALPQVCVTSHSALFLCALTVCVCSSNNGGWVLYFPAKWRLVLNPASALSLSVEFQCDTRAAWETGLDLWLNKVVLFFSFFLSFCLFHVIAEPDGVMLRGETSSSSCCRFQLQLAILMDLMRNWCKWVSNKIRLNFFIFVYTHTLDFLFFPAHCRFIQSCNRTESAADHVMVSNTVMLTLNTLIFFFFKHTVWKHPVIDRCPVQGERVFVRL